MNQQNIYGSTATCNVPSTSNLPQHSGGIPNPTMYYVSQLPTDPYGQQILQFGDSFPQESVYPPPSKEMYTSSTSAFPSRLLSSYNYNNTIQPGQNDFASTIAPHFQPQPLPNQNNSTVTQQLIQQSHSQQSQQQYGAAAQRQVLPSLMHPPPPKAAFAKRGHEPQTYQVNFQNSSACNNSSTAISYQPKMSQPQQQKAHNPQNNGNDNANNGQDQRGSRLSTMFDTTDNYTASWVSSTSSIPADQKIPPNSGHDSPTAFEFSNWANELPKMAADTQAQTSALASNIPAMQTQQQPTHVYAGQPQFHIPTTNHSCMPMPYYAPNQPQFAAPPNMSYYPMTPYMPYPSYVMPGTVAPGIPNYQLPAVFAQQQYISPLAFMHHPPYSPFWPSDVRQPDTQDEKFFGTWLDQTLTTQQELEIFREVIPHALEHNYRKGHMTQPGSRSNGLLATVVQHHQPMPSNSGNDSGYGGDNHRGNGSNFRQPFRGGKRGAHRGNVSRQ